MLSDAEWSQLRRHLRLTPRELEILRCVFEEKTDDAIASALRISPRTVRSHLENLYRKCGCTSRTGAVVSVFRAYIEKMTDRAR